MRAYALRIIHNTMCKQDYMHGSEAYPYIHTKALSVRVCVLRQRAQVLHMHTDTDTDTDTDTNTHQMIQMQ